MKLSLGLLGMESLVGGDFAALRDLVALADRKGVDQVSAIDHVIMGEHHEEYPYGPFRGTSHTPFLDPLTELATYAAVTTNIRLSSGIVISPLRPAVVLAKQLATLDVLSRGRVEIGLGVGWQSAEYVAAGVPWEHRFAILEEQIRVCRALWAGGDVTFRGEHVSFEHMTSMPQPVQGARLPIWLGVALKRRNIERIAELCDGWIPMEHDKATLKTEIDMLKRAFEARGRDPGALQVRATYEIRRGADGKVDLGATLAQTKAYADAGVTMLRLETRVLCRRIEDFEAFLERVVQVKDVVAA